MKITLSLVFAVTFSITSAQSWKELKSAATKAQTVISGDKLSQDEVAKGLKEALVIGATNSIKNASAAGGFSNNNLIRIPFPAEAEKIKKALIKIGMQVQINQFEQTLNAAAEDASKFANEIFIEAVKNMSIKDAMSILKGNDEAATFYLEEQTSKDLYLKFKPVVKKSIKKVKLTKYWNTLSSRYNALPMTSNVNPDLEDYVTIKAINGLFLLIAKEEKLIRNNPKARVSGILQKVFK